jgi:cytochrome d ubiquinol oxidase subunit II
LLCGLVSVAMLAMHGASWLVFKTAGPVADRARKYGMVAALLTIALYALAGVLLMAVIDGYQVTSTVDVLGPSNPMIKTAVVRAGAWMANYAAHPWTMAAPAAGFIGALGAFVALMARRGGLALLCSAIGIAGIILCVGASMFPFILPSSIDPRASLTVWDSSSSHLTLFIMLVTTCIFLPIVVGYTSWVYHVLWGKVDEVAIREERGHAY